MQRKKVSRTGSNWNEYPEGLVDAAGMYESWLQPLMPVRSAHRAPPRARIEILQVRFLGGKLNKSATRAGDPRRTPKSTGPRRNGALGVSLGGVMGH